MKMVFEQNPTSELPTGEQQEQQQAAADDHHQKVLKPSPESSEAKNLMVLLVVPDETGCNGSKGSGFGGDEPLKTNKLAQEEDADSASGDTALTSTNESAFSNASPVQKHLSSTATDLGFDLSSHHSDEMVEVLYETDSVIEIIDDGSSCGSDHGCALGNSVEIVVDPALIDEISANEAERFVVGEQDIYEEIMEEITVGDDFSVGGYYTEETVDDDDNGNDDDGFDFDDKTTEDEENNVVGEENKKVEVSLKESEETEKNITQTQAKNRDSNSATPVTSNASPPEEPRVWKKPSTKPTTTAPFLNAPKEEAQTASKPILLPRKVWKRPSTPSLEEAQTASKPIVAKKVWEKTPTSSPTCMSSTPSTEPAVAKKVWKKAAVSTPLPFMVATEESSPLKRTAKKAEDVVSPQKPIIIGAKSVWKRPACARPPPPAFRSAQEASRTSVNAENVSEENAGDNETYYFLIDLQSTAIPDIDNSRREIYLSPQEFFDTFGMAKDEFAGQKKWKRDKAKRAAKLF
jgi:hypothetical protein